MTPELKALLLEYARIYIAWQDAIDEQGRLNRAHERAIEDSPEWIDTLDAWIEAQGRRNALWGEHLKIEKKLAKYIEKEMK